jgi:hypothetical protein
MRYCFLMIVALAVMLPSPVLSLDSASMAPKDAFLFISLSDAAFMQKVKDAGFFAGLYETRRIFGDQPDVDGHLKNWMQDLPVTFDEWIRIFPGIQCCYLTGLEFRSGSAPVFDITLILEHDGNAEGAAGFVDNLVNHLAPDAKRNHYDYKGVKVFTLDYTKRKSGKIAPSLPVEKNKPAESPSSPGKTIEDGVFQELSFHFQYAFVDRFLFFCEGKGEPLKALLDRYQAPGRSSLSDLKSYKNLFEGIPDEHCVKVYFNLEDIFTRFADFQKKEGKPDLSSFSLAEIKGLGISQFISPHAFESHVRLYAPSQRTGIGEVFFQFRENPFSTLKFVPSDTVAFASLSLDIFRIYHVLLAALGSVYSQEVASLRQTIQANNLLLGVDLENQILGQMKGEMGYYARSIKETSGMDRISGVYFIELDKSALFKESLKKLFIFARNNLAMEMQEKKHMDVEYWVPAPMGQSVKQEDFIPPFGIFIHEKYLFVSRDIPELLNLIARLKSGEDNVVFSNKLKQFMERHPAANLVGIRFVDQPAPLHFSGDVRSLVEGIAPGIPVLRESGNGNIVSNKTLVYQDRDMFSILTELSFSEGEPGKRNP